jgi:FKBP-type peptidyl-prolyl cis-trans isomerase
MQRTALRAAADAERYTDAEHRVAAILPILDTMKTILAMLVAALVSAACDTRSHEAAGDSASNREIRTTSGLMYRTTHDGTGPVARRGDTVRIHETLSLADGRVIFSSREKGTPVTFVLGANQVIPGVDEGVSGMRVGERRALVVPPSLDGRTYDPALIPAGSTLYYDIELLAIGK